MCMGSISFVQCRAHFDLNFRGEQHGEDMLGHISVVFKQSKVPLAVALVTDALASLCQCDVSVYIDSILGFFNFSSSGCRSCDSVVCFRWKTSLQ